MMRRWSACVRPDSAWASGSMTWMSMSRLSSSREYTLPMSLPSIQSRATLIGHTTGESSALQQERLLRPPPLSESSARAKDGIPELSSRDPHENFHDPDGMRPHV